MYFVTYTMYVLQNTKEHKYVLNGAYRGFKT